MSIKRVLYLFLLFSAGLHSQKLDKESFMGVINAEDSFDVQKRYVDSMLTIEKITDTDKSYIHHCYASILFKNKIAELSYLHLKEAIRLRKINNELIPLKKSMFNLGLYYRRENKTIKAINVHKELIHLPKDDRIRAKAYSELITLYEKIGDYEKSKLYYQKSTHYYTVAKDYRNLYKNHMRMSKVYAAIGGSEYFNKVLYYIKKADSLRKYTTIELRDDAIINLRLGNVYEDVNQIDKAELHYKKALLISEKLNDSLTVSLLSNNIADLYINNTNSYVKAKQLLAKSELYARNNITSKALVYSTYGSYYTWVKEFEKAKNYYEKAIQLQVGANNSIAYVNPDIAKLATLPNKLRLYDFIVQKANFWFRLYDENLDENYLEKALTDYKLADKLLDVIRFESSEKKSKLFWREKGADLYIKAVKACYLLQDTANAYYFMEKNKALLLLEELNSQKAQVLSKLPEKLIARDYMFKEKIIEAEESNRTNKLDKIFNLKKSYEQFKDSIAENYPAYSKLKKSLPVLTIKSHYKYFIKNNTASIQYIVNKGLAYGLIITEKETSLFKIDNATALQQDITTFIQQVQYPFNTQNDVNVYVKNAFGIFQALFPNKEFEKLKGKRITIAADGVIQNIPFEALITNEKKQDSYLIKNNEVNYVYSFSYLNSNKNKTRNPKHTFIGFAPEKFQNKTLAHLPNSVNEIRDINTIFSDEIFVNSQATKLSFKQNFEAYKMVHLATHSGLSGSETPWLAFNDGCVSLNEIYATQSQADLVVLSACETSKGKLKTGEGIMSLARGFFFSGANSVISTLWSVNDKTTQRLMYSFYENLEKGSTKSAALHNSKLSYLNTHSGTAASPYYWSSFVLIGDAEAILLVQNYGWIKLLALIVVLALLVFLCFKKIKIDIDR